MRPVIRVKPAVKKENAPTDLFTGLLRGFSRSREVPSKNSTAAMIKRGYPINSGRGIPDLLSSIER
jgi:hypothetical protein